MSKQYPGGLITKSPVVPSGPYEDSSASGIWTLDQQAYWRKLNQWPIAGSVVPDPQFNYVTMLLHGDGTNGAQNNTFLDSSTNNFTITRNGNTTQGSFSPYGSNWSNLFGGSSSITAPDNSAFDYGSGDFTLECWIFPTTTNSGTLLTAQTNGSSYGPCNLFFAGGALELYSSSNNSSFDVASGASVGTPAVGQWSHVAVSRSGTSIRCFLNGTLTSTTTSSATLMNATGTFQIASRNGGEFYSGYVSNFRVVKGTAVYTAAFTPPTAPLTAISGTSLLTCADNRFIDDSTNNFTLTTIGTPSVQRFNPFGTSTAYSTSVIGGSAYYDASGDSLSTPASSANNPQSGDDYTVEAWIYITVVGGVTSIYSGNATGYFAYRSAGRFEFVSSSLELRLTFPVPLNQWCHAAVTRQSGTVRMFINGALTSPTVASGSATGNTDTLVGASTVYYFGSYTDSTSGPFGGYISNFRIVKGTAVYTAAFTPPTAPLTAVTNTAILLNNINGAIFDNAMINNLETAGSTQISTSVKKYGTGSIAFNATSNTYLQAQYALLNSSGPFTFECWAYWNDTGTSGSMGMLCSQYQSASSGRMLFGSQSGNLVLRVDGGTVYLTTSVSTGIWYFIAWTFDGTTHRLFKDGVLVSSSASVPALYTGVRTSMGGQSDTLLAGYNLDGYMDEIRTSNFCRYTATFTPPTAAFPNIGPV
jgi:hypothetical protein